MFYYDLLPYIGGFLTQVIFLRWLSVWFAKEHWKQVFWTALALFPVFAVAVFAGEPVLTDQTIEDMCYQAFNTAFFHWTLASLASVLLVWRLRMRAEKRAERALMREQDDQICHN
ncbi:MAG TPA: hypothetical protein VNI20_08410 [Fimbriimonadaceae bacterium]|nr:hypothetical protein [Fimbriimonadaceae bacterium]